MNVFFHFEFKFFVLKSEVKIVSNILVKISNNSVKISKILVEIFKISDDSHVLCQNTGRKSNWKVISLTLKVISFFFCRFEPLKLFSAKKKRISQKKRISFHISFDFLGQNPGIISGKRLPQTAKNGAKKKVLFWNEHFQNW